MLNVGGIESTTVTTVKATALLPDASTAVKVTLVVPRGKTAGASLDTGTEPPQLSLAVGSGTATDVPDGPVCSTTIGPGTPANTGGAVSRTVITTASVAIPPRPSFTVSVIV